MIWFVIIGMALVTVIPRLIPAFLVGEKPIPGWANRWLNGIPFAALGALIFPGVLSVNPAQPMAGLIGAVAATGMAFFKLNIFFVVFGAIFVVYIANLLL